MRTVAQEVANLIINEITPREKRGLPVPSPQELRALAELKVAGHITHAEVRRAIKAQAAMGGGDAK